VSATSTAALPLDAIIAEGVVGRPDVDCIAARDGDSVHALIWNYHDDDLPAEGTVQVALEVNGLPGKPFAARHYRVDGEYSNAHSAFRAMGSPPSPSPEQYAALEATSHLAIFGSSERLSPDGGRLRLDFSLPRHAISLISLVPA
jgi:xylan 1,4-beta-xylosidase